MRKSGGVFEEIIASFPTTPLTVSRSPTTTFNHIQKTPIISYYQKSNLTWENYHFISPRYQGSIEVKRQLAIATTVLTR